MNKLRYTQLKQRFRNENADICTEFNCYDKYYSVLCDHWGTHFNVNIMIKKNNFRF